MSDQQHSYNQGKAAADDATVGARFREILAEKAKPQHPMRTCTCGATVNCSCEEPSK